MIHGGAAYLRFQTIRCAKKYEFNYSNHNQSTIPFSLFFVFCFLFFVFVFCFLFSSKIIRESPNFQNVMRGLHIYKTTLKLSDGCPGLPHPPSSNSTGTEDFAPASTSKPPDAHFGPPQSTSSSPTCRVDFHSSSTSKPPAAHLGPPTCTCRSCLG